jgi:hypothetical protein
MILEWWNEARFQALVIKIIIATIIEHLFHAKNCANMYFLNKCITYIIALGQKVHIIHVPLGEFSQTDHSYMASNKFKTENITYAKQVYDVVFFIPIF